MMIETNSACWSCLSAADLVNLIDSICFGLKYGLSHVNVCTKKIQLCVFGASCLSSEWHSIAVF